MAIKKIYIGSLGPFPYDDTVAIDDADGDFAGVTQKGLSTQGQLYVEDVPTLDNHVLRKVDIGSLPTGASLTVVSETSFGQASAVGTADTFSRGDHTHGTPSNPITQQSAISDVPTGGSATAADNATAINSILAALRANNIIAT